MGKQQTETLLRLIQTMVSETDYQQLMQRIMEASYILVTADLISLFSVHAESGEIVCQVSKDKSQQGARFKYGQGPVGTVAKTKKSLNIPDAYKDERFNPKTDERHGYRTYSILTVPVLDLEKEVVAVIQAVNRRRERKGVISGYDDEERDERKKIFPRDSHSSSSSSSIDSEDEDGPKLQIGRAVQQECRDRSRMPSSA
eukprot:TRINITY_DN9498_c0_g1_i11.p1 TRINITY_DN9498_c0_g1~~TRINITY_DN9498_c0_g1_i11.p1  ORF type:complete len:225 (-),score=38.92 TRINITY_DN9498_c0_g1_i11:18-617(-)